MASERDHERTTPLSRQIPPPLFAFYVRSKEHPFHEEQPPNVVKSI
jgi:hypothetical protein